MIKVKFVTETANCRGCEWPLADCENNMKPSLSVGGFCGHAKKLRLGLLKNLPIFRHVIEMSFQINTWFNCTKVHCHKIDTVHTC